MRTINIFVSIATIFRGAHGETLATAGFNSGGGAMSSAVTDAVVQADRSLAKALVQFFPDSIANRYSGPLGESAEMLHHTIIQHPSEVYGWLKDGGSTPDLVQKAFDLNGLSPEKYGKFVNGYKSFYERGG